MNAIQFIKDHGVEKAREVVEGAPDKTATHYVFRKIHNYYSVDFQSWFHDGEWWDSDCYNEQDLIDSYGVEFVVNLSYLKRLVESVDFINKFGGIDLAKAYNKEMSTHGFDPFFEKAIADYEAIYSGVHQ
ncbi:hypothetical protein [Acinetobacter modestus]|uniref:hypothetical protein n=1 Tax=Acinetobacter modestus TaxID=1776740 RepID=UPI0030164C5B